MKFCVKCGKELMDDSIVCPGCGNTVGAAEVDVKQPKRPKSKKKRIICCVLIPIISLVLVVGVLAILILPHPDLKMKDIQDGGYIDALFRYGIPQNVNSDKGIWIYEDCIKFYGIPARAFSYRPGEYFYFWFGEEYEDDVLDEIRKHCDYEDNFGSKYNYSYNGMEIITDGAYLHISLD